ncbi:hypothetical protein [Holospora undulata]|uniref:Uncharacterized protein n=1 Tax=Holospora undulata HU1 TaxID=1321371 RepID=A0A061JHP3_9PROT|nr:hypothetical protein [Holospora undulata]ETZ04893.1 hypothetical protein K737_300688 [Holospora undulata HU1]
MKATYSTRILNMGSALSNMNAASPNYKEPRYAHFEGEKRKELIEKYKKESMEKSKEYEFQMATLIKSMPDMEDKIKQALEKYQLAIPFEKFWDHVKAIYYKNLRNVLLNDYLEYYGKNFLNGERITVYLDLSEEDKFFRGVKIEEKEKEIRKIVSEPEGDSIKKFFKSIKDKLT